MSRHQGSQAWLDDRRERVEAYAAAQQADSAQAKEIERMTVKSRAGAIKKPKVDPDVMFDGASELGDALDELAAAIEKAEQRAALAGSGRQTRLNREA